GPAVCSGASPSMSRSASRAIPDATSAMTVSACGPLRLKKRSSPIGALKTDTGNPDRVGAKAERTRTEDTDGGLTPEHATCRDIPAEDVNEVAAGILARGSLRCLT